jgi:asparagine synthase (glutamine-hydrolysing)
LLGPELPPALDRVLCELRDRSPGYDDLAPYLWFDQKYFLPDDILNKADRMSMAHSLEVRPPFLDHRIVEFAASLPASLKIRGYRQKLVLKELMRDKLPSSVLRRKKIGFDIPAHDWMRGCLRPLMMDVLLDDTSDHAGLFRREVIETYIRHHLERRINVGYHLWGLMVLFLWMKKWGVQAAAPRQTKVWIQEKATTYI